MSTSWTFFEEVHNYVNNFQSYRSYENYCQNKNLPNHRKELQNFIHGVLTNYHIQSIGGIISFFY